MLKVYFTAIIYKFLWLFVMPFIKRKYHPTIINAEVIPKKGPIVFCGNHRHKMDQYLFIASTDRVIHWAAKEEYFNGKDNLFGKTTPFGCWFTTIFLKLIGSICIDRNGFSGSALKEMYHYLQVGSCVGIFPEGTRNKSKEPLLPFKKGAVMIAKKTDAWIQPASITGRYSKKNTNLIICFGTPFKATNMLIDDANERLRQEILKGISLQTIEKTN